MTEIRGNSRSHIYRALVGVLLIAAGALLFVDRVFDVYTGGFGTWWPLILVGLGLWKMAEAPERSNRNGPLILVLVGCAFLVKPVLRLVTGDADFVDLFRVWPLIIVAVGVGIVWKALVPARRPEGDTRPKGDNS